MRKKKLIAIDIDGTIFDAASFTDLPENVAAFETESVDFSAFGVNGLTFSAFNGDAHSKVPPKSVSKTAARAILREIKQENIVLINTGNDSLFKANQIVGAIAGEINQIAGPELKSDLLKKFNDNFYIATSYGGKIVKAKLNRGKITYSHVAKHVANFACVKKLVEAGVRKGLAGYNFEKVLCPIANSSAPYPQNLQICDKTAEAVFLIEREQVAESDFDYIEEQEKWKNLIEKNECLGLVFRYNSPLHVAFGALGASKAVAIQDVAKLHGISPQNCFMIGNSAEDLIDQKVANTIIISTELNSAEEKHIRAKGASLVIDLNQAFEHVSQQSNKDFLQTL